MSIPRQKPTARPDGGDATDTFAVAVNTVTKYDEPSSPPSCFALFLVKLTRKVKRQGKMLLEAAKAAGGRRSSFKCRYDPLSYSLNFDGGACGRLSDDEDYYLRFYAFSSRFAANKRPSPCKTLVATSH